MKIKQVNFYQRVEVGGNDLSISFACAVKLSEQVKVYGLELIDGLGVQVTGEHKTLIVPFNNIASIEVLREVATVPEEKPKSKKGA